MKVVIDYKTDQITYYKFKNRLEITKVPIYKFMSSYNLTILCVDFGILSVWIFSA